MRLLLSTVLAFGIGLPAGAQVYFATTMREKVQSADAIAVVRIKQIDKINNAIDGYFFPKYRQHAVALVEETIKGNLPNKIDLYGDDDGSVSCTPNVLLQTGQWLVFLSHVNPSSWLVSGGERGFLRITANGKVHPYNANPERLTAYVHRIQKALDADDEKKCSPVTSRAEQVP